MKPLVNYGIAFGICFALLYLIPLDSRALWQPDETRYAQISSEMLVSGNWVVPHFLELRYFEKPVFGYWINNISQFIFGHNNFAVRFGSVFSTASSALLVVWLAFRLWRDKAIAALSGVIYLTCFLVYGIGTYSVLDPMLTLCLTGAMCFFWAASSTNTTRAKIGGYILLGFACGLGVMSKGFLALAIPVVGVLPWVVLQKRWKELFLFGPVAIISAVVIVLPWALAIAREEPDYWRYFFWVEHIQRFAEDNAQHKAPFWYYLPIFIVGCMPWLGLLPGALKRGFQERSSENGSFYLLGWVIMPLLFFSIAKGKLPTYILPCFAPLSILMARHAVILAKSKARTLRVNGWVNVIFGLICVLVVLVALAPWGMGAHTLYDENEVNKVMLGSFAFLVWAVVGIITLFHSERRWFWAGCCPLGIALLVGFAIPDSVVHSKQPQAFIEAVRPELADSQYILASNTGIASGIAWEMKRSDIDLYKSRGELGYGLAYPGNEDRYTTAQAFPQWLAEHRKSGNVSLVVLTTRNETLEEMNLPPADYTYSDGRLVLLQYFKQP
ncbi:lipid IV(A) 4-amino-4-deoxy-L-arabinosyltransferase [Citrobacter sp. JGM124]|uniref:lipid IV(A) 4-amino-4-deoxy-L-arabinosyltransferase n=1 Tax=Citrobacter sp. JGM124 TaxID=2799789 RepID=UPI001BAAE4E1|nr:lipid IV(A) 4-amino-4-deoxy-L-arabinosyltransferase [Citrobacter sp. JGM124]MBS0847146.1 lipid IV(A) 4-amino-4-deoxy-L-arabinosyltransferase [Citrobacter sp. JGM124]